LIDFIHDSWVFVFWSIANVAGLAGVMWSLLLLLVALLHDLQHEMQFESVSLIMSSHSYQIKQMQLIKELKSITLS
jgi:hypothetical protein